MMTTYHDLERGLRRLEERTYSDSFSLCKLTEFMNATSILLDASPC
jgi:hypothetical protein